MPPKSKDTFKEPAGWILYDGQCAFCVGSARRFERPFQHRGFCFAPLQTPWVRERLSLPPKDLLEEMRVITNTNQILGGADAVLYLSKMVWWGWPLYALGCIPGFKSLLRSLYRSIARRRQCIGGTCSLGAQS